MVWVWVKGVEDFSVADAAAQVGPQSSDWLYELIPHQLAPRGQEGAWKWIHLWTARRRRDDRSRMIYLDQAPVGVLLLRYNST